MIKRCAWVDKDGNVKNVSVHCTVKSKDVKPKPGHSFVFHEKADVGDWWDHKQEELHKMCSAKKKDCQHDNAGSVGLPHAYMKWPKQIYQGE